MTLGGVMAKADFTIKQGDQAPSYTETLKNADGTVIDLTGATVRLQVRSLTAATPITLTGTQTVTDAPNGTVTWAPTTQDTQTSGMFMAAWQITYANGKIQTCPTDGYLWIRIEENLTTTGGQQLVSLPDVKDHLNINASDRATDAKLIRFIRAARPIVERITGPIIPQTFDEWHDGGQTFIQVRRRPSTGYGTTPILELLGVDEYQGSTKYTLDPVADPAAGSTYSVHMDRLGKVTRRTAGGGVSAFPAAPESVHVIYRAGQASIPDNVYEGTLELLRVNYETTMAVGRGSRTRADENDIGPPLGFFVPRRVREQLAPNRRAPSIA